MLIVTAAFLPLDLIFSVPQTPGLIASRVLLFLSFGATAWGLPKLDARGRTWVLTGLGALSPISVALMCWGTGGTASPAFSFLWVLPVLVGIVCLEEPTADVVATFVTIGCGVLLLTSEGRGAAHVLYFVLVTTTLGTLSAAGTWLRRKNHRAELIALKERDDDRRRTEEALAAARQRLAQTDRVTALGTLAAGIAHEINNPLAAVVANVSYVSESLGKSAPLDVKELCVALSDAQQAAMRVRDIVKDFKAFSPSPDDRRERMPLARCLEVAVALAGNELKDRAKLVREGAPLPEVLANGPKLVQVFVNLLHNAAQAIAEGRPEVNTVTVRTSVGADGEAVVEVIDTGAGIPADVLPHIFEPFITTKLHGGGGGAGLSVCHAIVQQHGGELEVETGLGKGSTFRVKLPAAPKPEAPPAPKPSAPRPKDGRSVVAVIDDDEIVGKSLQRMLERHFEVHRFTDARAALAWLAQGEHCDAVVCDLMMPVMGGIEFHAELVKARPMLAARVVFATGGAFTARGQQFLSTAKFTLEKPFDQGLVLKMVRQALQT
ncbi:MAG: response regulator [Myxococcaceae bacterium]|nr:response regulator [Myxococcaceae bacterium]